MNKRISFLKKQKQITGHPFVIHIKTERLPAWRIMKKDRFCLICRKVFENYTQFIGREVVPHTVYKPQVTKE